MSTGGRHLSLALLLLFLLIPGLAAAAPASGAPRPIALADYRAMLQTGISHLERADQLIKAGKTPEAVQEIRSARPLLTGVWAVESRQGTVSADLTDLDYFLELAVTNGVPQQNLPRALALSRELLAAAESLEQAKRTELPGARATLDEALKQTTARSVLQRFFDWLNQLLGRGSGQPTGVSLPRYVYFIIGGLGLAVLIWLGFSLYRSLAGHAAGGEATLKGSREHRPQRPLTPLELWESARGLSERGDHLEAIRRAHLALLQRYDALQLIRYVPAQTNREHERQLRYRHPQLARTLRTLNDLVDDRLYSGHGAAAADFLRVDGLVDQLWREGDALSTGAKATTGA